MSGGPSKQDHDLLARLHALKKSTVEFDENKSVVPTSTSNSSAPDHPALAGRALHAELADRFNSLHKKSSNTRTLAKTKSGTALDIPELQNEDNDKTVEDLLADLGPDESWDVGKTDEDQINDLLKQAKTSLRDFDDAPKSPTEVESEQDAPQISKPRSSLISIIDVSAFQPEPDSEPEDPENDPKRPNDLKQSINEEADSHLQRILDEMNHERSHPSQETDEDPPPEYSEDPTPPDSQILDLPSAGQKALPTSPSPSRSPTSDLAARFSSLSLPNQLSLPSAPTTPPIPKPSISTSNPNHRSTSSTDFSDSEISTWCIICNADANLQCVGCEGDLYCTNCWMEGHRGEGAGMEERRHRAVVYGKKGKKEGKRRVAVGA